MPGGGVGRRWSPLPGASREVAEAMLRGEGLRAEAGTYAFVDGNAMGGIGVVLVNQAESGPGLLGPRACPDGLRRLRAGCEHESRHAPEDHRGDR